MIGASLALVAWLFLYSTRLMALRAVGLQDGHHREFHERGAYTVPH
jgi:hypothetical protein